MPVPEAYVMVTVISFVGIYSLVTHNATWSEPYGRATDTGIASVFHGTSSSASQFQVTLPPFLLTQDGNMQYTVFVPGVWV